MGRTYLTWVRTFNVCGCQQVCLRSRCTSTHSICRINCRTWPYIWSRSGSSKWGSSEQSLSLCVHWTKKCTFEGCNLVSKARQSFGRPPRVCNGSFVAITTNTGVKHKLLANRAATSASIVHGPPRETAFVRPSHFTVFHQPCSNRIGNKLHSEPRVAVEADGSARSNVKEFDTNLDSAATTSKLDCSLLSPSCRSFFAPPAMTTQSGKELPN
jgi:hypothetical protein